MRDLIIVRGAPASGKSSWIAGTGLAPYAVSPDAARAMFSCPIADQTTGIIGPNMRNEHLVWSYVKDAVELRMRMGQFIVLDTQASMYHTWLELAKKYRYKVWVKEINTPKEICLKRNAKRRGSVRLPDYAMEQAFMWLENHKLPAYVEPVTDEVVQGIVKPVNCDQYERIHFCGDIHSCIQPLRQFHKETKGFPETDLIVFVGDYIDRGLAHKETLEFLVSLREKPNIIFLEGNHQGELRWANNQVADIRSQEFLTNTMPALKGVDKRTVKEWCAKWKQMAYLEFHGRRFFVTHAGLGYLPTHIRRTPTNLFIRCDRYEADIDRAWCEQCYGSNLIQVHGHRNWYGYRMEDTGESINLNSPVEFGDDWRVYTVSADGTDEYHYYSNPDHREINSSLAEFMAEPNVIIEEKHNGK